MARGPSSHLPGAADPSGEKEETGQQALALPVAEEPQQGEFPLIEALNSSSLLLKESCTSNGPRFTEEELLIAAKALAAELCPSPGVPVWSKQPHLRTHLTLAVAGTILVLLCIFSLACASIAVHSPGINGDGVQHTSAGGLTIKSGLAVQHVALEDLHMVSSQDLSFLRDVVLWTEDGHMHVLHVLRAIRYSANHVALDLRGGHSLEFMAGQHFLLWSDGTRDRIQLRAGQNMASSGAYFLVGGVA